MAWYDNQDLRDGYVGHWSSSLQAFLCWSPERAQRWARYRWHCLGDNAFLTHDTASWYLVNLLLPPELADNLDTAARISLHGQIERAIESARSAEAPYECDFALARRAIQAILSPYGFALPQSEQQADREGWGGPSSDTSAIGESS